MKKAEAGECQQMYVRYLDFDITNDLVVDVKRYFLKFDRLDTFEHTKDVIDELDYMNSYFGKVEPGSRIACYCHDLGRVVRNDEILGFCAYNNIEVSEEEMRIPSILHQKISHFIAQHVFKIEDEMILNAIKYHTTLRKNPSVTEIEVFLADKMSWKETGYLELAQTVRSVMLKSKEAAVYWYLTDLNKKKQELLLYHNDTKEAYDWFRDNEISNKVSPKDRMKKRD